MKCDLSGDKPLPAQWIGWLNQISEETRRPIVGLVDTLSRNYSDHLAWICSPIACRNPYSSSFINDLNLLCLALRVADNQEDLTEVVMPSSALASVLRRELWLRGRRNIQVRVRPWGLRDSVTLRTLYRLFAAGYHAMARFISSRAANIRDMPVPRVPIVLVDTFVYSDSFLDGFRDRHYPELLDLINDREKSEIFFVPTCYKVKNYFRQFREIKRSGVQFLVKDSFLSFGDYLTALRDAWSLPDPAKDMCCGFMGMDISEVVSDAVDNSRMSSGLIEGLLTYRFIRRLKERGVNVRLAVDWFENHELDKGFNAAFRRYYPDADSIGYQGFVVSKDYLCMFPSAYDYEGHLIPKRVAVMGNGLIAGVKEFCPELNVFSAPALRFGAVWQPLSERAGQAVFSILVALPIFERDARELIQAVCGAVRVHLSLHGDNRTWRVFVKAHPASRRLSVAEGEEMGIQYVNGSFQSALESADVLVSNTSSVCLESVARGVPVIVVGGRYGVTHNPIPSAVPEEIWTLCLEVEEIHRALLRFSDRRTETLRERCKLSDEVKKRYFEPVSADAVRHMLGFCGP